MKLIFLHGPPAAGKLTTAKALLRAVPGRLFDNHAAIDVARTVFDFGAPGFWDLVHTVRMSVLDAAAGNGVPLVVMTFVYVDPHDLMHFEQFESIVQRHGGQLVPVFLYCSRAQGAQAVAHQLALAQGTERGGSVDIFRERVAKSADYRHIARADQVASAGSAAPEAGNRHQAAHRRSAGFPA